MRCSLRSPCEPEAFRRMAAPLRSSDRQILAEQFGGTVAAGHVEVISGSVDQRMEEADRARQARSPDFAARRRSE